MSAARRAVVLARRCGDFQGLGHALNGMALAEPDLARRLRLLRESAAAYRAAGDLDGLASSNYNLAGAYMHLGLYWRAVRHCTKKRRPRTNRKRLTVLFFKVIVPFSKILPPRC